MNKKGMTLIEVLLTVAILTSASLMLFTCLANVVHFMSESNKIKNASDSMLAYIEGNEEVDITDDVSSINKSNISYTLSYDTNKVVVNEELNDYNSKKYADLLLRSFTPRVITSDPDGDFDDDIFTVGGDYKRCLKEDSSLKVNDYKVSGKYEKGSFVNYNGKMYRKLTILSQTGEKPSEDTLNWREVDKEYKKNNYYFVGEIVSYDGNYLQLIRDSGLATSLIPSSDWQSISSKSGTYFKSALELVHDGTLRRQADTKLGGVVEHKHLPNEPAIK